jgi:hypothetical protein
LAAPSASSIASFGVVAAELLLRGGLVVVGEVAQEQKREHVVPKVVGVHGAAQRVGNVPEDSAELFLVGFGHREIKSK